MKLIRDAIDRLSEEKREELARLLGGMITGVATTGTARSDDVRLDPGPLGDSLQGLLHASDTERTEELLGRLIDLDIDLADAALLDLKKDTRLSHQNLVWDFLQARRRAGLRLPGEADWSMAREVLARHPDEESRLAAVRMLQEIDSEQARVSLAWGLGDSSRKVVTTILEGAFTESSSFAIWLVDHAINQSRNDHPEWVADWSVERGRVSLELLALSWRSNSPSLTSATLSALIQHEPSLFIAWWDERIGDRSDEKRREAIFSLGCLTEADEIELNKTDPRFLGRALSVAESMIEDPLPAIRFVVLKSLADRGLPSAIVHARNLIEDPDAGIRKRALELIVNHGHPSDIPRILSLWNDPNGGIEAASVTAMHSFGEKRGAWIDGIRKLLKHSDEDLRVNAVRFLGLHGKSEDLESILPLIADEDYDVRLAALNAAILLAPSQAVEFAGICLTDKDDDVVKRALEVLEKELGSSETVDRALDSLPKAKGDGGLVLLNLLLDKTPERSVKILDAALRSKSSYVREWAVEHVEEKQGREGLTTLMRLTRDKNGDVRKEALDALYRLFPEKELGLALNVLSDDDYEVRVAAVEVVGRHEDPSHIDLLVARARDKDDDVRQAAMEALAAYDDPRILSEMISALNDVDKDVRDLARKLLDGKKESMPALRRLVKTPGGRADWKRIVERVDRVNLWAARIGRELLGVPVVVHQYRQGAGRTGSPGKKRIVHIEVSDSAVTGSDPHGEQIMKGLALHEIGHHLCDIGVRGYSATRGIACSEGVEEIFLILLDERLERVLRARRPEWGVYLDRLNSYLFASGAVEVPLDRYADLIEMNTDELLDAINDGELPGGMIRPGPGGTKTITLRESEMLGVPDLIPPLDAFLACLLCGFDPDLYADDTIARAIALVPADLRNSTHAEILEVSKKIADLIGRTEDHKKARLRFHRSVRRFQRMLAGLAEAMRRMASTGLAPDWMREGTPGIRENRTAGMAELDDRWKRNQANLGPETRFNSLVLEKTLRYDPAAHSALVRPIRKHIRVLRRYLEQLGTRPTDLHASKRGQRIDLGAVRRGVLLGKPNILIHSTQVTAPDAYIGILIDRSGSMRGEKIETAKSFGALVAESARGLSGIAGDVSAFDDSTFYRLGGFTRNAIASLEAGEGNNDAGGLERAAELALRSPKKNRMIIMISDGMPTDCTVEALRALVHNLTTRKGILCAQVAVDSIEEVAFPRFVDLSKYSLDEAVARFGRLLIRLTSSWR